MIICIYIYVYIYIYIEIEIDRYIYIYIYIYIYWRRPRRGAAGRGAEVPGPPGRGGWQRRYCIV